jgi:membrane associated rhomboid family serine protease
VPSISFGRRLSGERPGAPAVAARRQAQAAPDVLDGIPLLTLTFVLVLTSIFAVQRHAVIVQEAGLSTADLLALGGLSHSRVLGAGEWWRLFVTPLLHADTKHLLGNGLALLVLGFKLEPLIGRQWFGATLFLGALGGSLSSLYLNTGDVVSVGASGAILALVATLFMCFLHGEVEDDRGHWLYLTAWIGVPALLPVAWGAENGTDHAAHLGGALAGLVIGSVILTVWRRAHLLSGSRETACWIAGFGLVCTLTASAFAATSYPTAAAKLSGLMPSAGQLNASKLDAQQLAEIERYPNDPRTHYIFAIRHLVAEKGAEAEAELRWIFNRRNELAVLLFPKLVKNAEVLLPVAFDMQRRRDEAISAARSTCLKPSSDPDRKLLSKRNLCPDR